MAITVRSNDKGASGGSANSATLRRPAGLAAGDFYLRALAFSNNAPGTISGAVGTAPTGITNPIQSGSNALALWVSRADGTEAATEVLTWPTASSVSWATVAVAGASALISAASATGAASTNHVAPSLSTTGVGRLLLCIFGADNFSGVTVSYTPPTGMTELLDQGAPSATTLTIDSQSLTSTGATGTRTAIASQSTAWAAISLAFRGGDTFAALGGLWVPQEEYSATGGSWT